MAIVAGSGLLVRAKSQAHFLLESLYNLFGTHIPSHHVRQTWLRLLGAEIGRDCALFRGVTVLGVGRLKVGNGSVAGWRCLLDARGGLVIGDNVSISSDSHIITADHDPRSRDFGVRVAPVSIESYAWIATGSIVLKGVTVGYGSVVAAGSVVVKDVPPLTVVGGTPARPISDRPADIRYSIKFRPLLY